MVTPPSIHILRARAMVSRCWGSAASSCATHRRGSRLTRARRESLYAVFFSHVLIGRNKPWTQLTSPSSNNQPYHTPTPTHPTHSTYPPIHKGPALRRNRGQRPPGPRRGALPLLQAALRVRGVRRVGPGGRGEPRGLFGGDGPPSAQRRGGMLNGVGVFGFISDLKCMCKYVYIQHM